jgi:hypothetical protein
MSERAASVTGSSMGRTPGALGGPGGSKLKLPKPKMTLFAAFAIGTFQLPNSTVAVIPRAWKSAFTAATTSPMLNGALTGTS